MLKVGDKIKIVNYSLFSIDDENKKEYYEISDIEEYGFDKYYFQVNEGSVVYWQGFSDEHIGEYVEKLEG